MHGSAEMVPLLVANGAKMENMDGGGYTPVQVSAYRGHVAVTRALLAAGAKHDTPYDNDWLALDMAADEGHVEEVTAIIEHGVDVNRAAGVDGCAPIHHAAKKNKPAVIDVSSRLEPTPNKRMGAARHLFMSLSATLSWL